MEANEIDLFEHYENLPIEVQLVLQNASNENTYESCRELEAELLPLGYTFEWGLDAEPYNLRKINE